VTARVPSRKRRFRDGLLMYMAVAIGAAIGGVLRASITMAALAQLGSGFLSLSETSSGLAGSGRWR
jgi:hypothetical protein